MPIAIAKPDSGRGAELIEQHAAKLPESLRNDFLKRADEIEREMFRTGMIDERRFRESLIHVAAVVQHNASVNDKK